MQLLRKLTFNENNKLLWKLTPNKHLIFLVKSSETEDKRSVYTLEVPKKLMVDFVSSNIILIAIAKEFHPCNTRKYKKILSGNFFKKMNFFLGISLQV